MHLRCASCALMGHRHAGKGLVTCRRTRGTAQKGGLVNPDPALYTMEYPGGSGLNQTGNRGVSSMTSQTEPDDAALVAAFIGGDAQAFKELVRRHQKPLYHFVWRQVRNHAETADLCQKVFLKVFLKIRGFRGESSFRTWLYQIALNQCKNHFRAKERERLDDVEIESLPLQDCPADAHAESAQESRMLRAAVEALPAKQRHTLELRFYQGLTFAEIAAGMNCPVGTAKANYHHAITALRKRMRGSGP